MSNLQQRIEEEQRKLDEWKQRVDDNLTQSSKVVFSPSQRVKRSIIKVKD